MAVTLKPNKPKTQAERDALIDAIMNGAPIEAGNEVEGDAATIAEMLPALLKKAALPDTSENRRKLINARLIQWAMPKTPPRSRSYRSLARHR